MKRHNMHIASIIDRRHNGAFDERKWCENKFGNEYNSDNTSGRWWYPLGYSFTELNLFKIIDSDKYRTFLFKKKEDLVFFNLVWG